MKLKPLAIVLAGTLLPGIAQTQDLPLSDVRAQLVARRFTTLSSEIAARIERITVREGEGFDEGEVLVELDCALLSAQLEEAKAGLEAAQKKQAVSQRLVELNSGGVLDATIAAAEAVQFAAKLHVAQTLVAKCTIRAPYSGRVVEQKARAHQYVQAGQPLLEILDDQALDVEFIAPSQWLSWLKPGLSFEVEIDETAKRYPGKIARIGARVDPISHTVEVTGEIINTPLDLVAGMSGRIVIEAGR